MSIEVNHWNLAVMNAAPGESEASIAITAIRAAIAAEREAIARHFDECDRLDPNERFPPGSVSKIIRARGNL